jgi:hypothetical protein
MLPQLSDFASDAFAAAHCFRYGGIEQGNGVSRLRLDFEPTNTMKEPDLRGAILLERDRYVMTEARLVFDRRRVGSDEADVEVDLEFGQVISGISLARRVCALTRFASSIAGDAGALRESQRLIALNFLRDAPGVVVMDTLLPPCPSR